MQMDLHLSNECYENYEILLAHCGQNQAIILLWNTVVDSFYVVQGPMGDLEMQWFPVALSLPEIVALNTHPEFGTTFKMFLSQYELDKFTLQNHDTRIERNPRLTNTQIKYIKNNYIPGEVTLETIAKYLQSNIVTVRDAYYGLRNYKEV